MLYLSPLGRGRPRSGRVRGMQRFRARARRSIGVHIVRATNTDVYENVAGVLEMIDRTLRPS